MDWLSTILQVLGAIFLVLLVLAFIAVGFIWYTVWRLRRGLRKFGRDMHSMGVSLGPIIGINPGRTPVTDDVIDVQAEPSQPLIEPTRSALDDDVLNGAIGNGLIRPEERAVAIVVHERSDVEELIRTLDLDNTPIFDPPDHRTGKEFLRDGPTREAFAKLNGMRMESDQFQQRGTVSTQGVEADVYMPPM
ncbi:MAG: hypothetical protein QM770_23420 [Tepidisphaeraceae bacterium]